MMWQSFRYTGNASVFSRSVAMAVVSITHMGMDMLLLLMVMLMGMPVGPIRRHAIQFCPAVRMVVMEIGMGWVVVVPVVMA